MSEAKKIIQNQGLPILVLAYNLYPHTAFLCSYLSRKYSVPWVPIIADSPTRSVYKSLCEHDNVLKKADGRVFFSRNYYESFLDNSPVLHFEGGVSPPNKLDQNNHDQSAEKSDDSFILMYAGSRGTHSGFQNLLKAVKLIRTKNIQIWITGTRSNLTISDPRIIDLGFVSRLELFERMAQADAFISPYPIGYKPNRYNFPSKLLEYLSRCKPVITTWTPGISSEYRKVLIVSSDDSPQSLAEAIDKVAGLSIEERQEITNNIYKFISDEKSWIKQGEKIVRWLESSIGVKVA